MTILFEKIMEYIEIKWAAQLAREHRDIAWKYGVNLATPTINISSGRKTLGMWSDKNKMLSISSHVIKTEGWDIVLEVLKHEMAHQYVSQFYNNSDGHGKYFKKVSRT